MIIYALHSSGQKDHYKYIGYTTGRLQKRINEHLSDSKNLRTIKDKWIQKELRLGNSILVDELDNATDINELKSKEIFYIKLFKSFGARLKNGTNGGDGVHGHKATKKLKDWNTATKSKPIYVFDYKTGKYLDTCKNIRDVCEKFNLTKSSVCYTLSGKNLKSKEFWLSHTNKFNPREKIKKITWNTGISTKGKQKFKVTPVIIEKNEEIYNFESSTEAAEFFNVGRHIILRTLQRQDKYCKKYNLKITRWIK